MKFELLNKFHNDTCFDAYNLFGCHKNSDGFSFCVWTPHAVSVSVVGTFNSWQEGANKMSLMSDGETYFCTVKNAKLGDEYKYLITTADGRKIYKCDPFATRTKFPNSTASVVYKKTYKPNFCRVSSTINNPINVYEVNLLSWKKTCDGKYLTYRQLAKRLVPYVKRMNYTHVEFMPITEYPFDNSWGYQVTGYFAPVARLGTPDDFAYLVDEFHKNGIGVILDWVPAHFPKDDFALFEFDGQPLFESSDPYKKEHEVWGTRKFDYSRNEITNFLVSSACFWLKEYNLDGLRVDAVASMLYLDYDKKEGEWIPNEYGDNRNLEGISFIKKLNATIKREVPDAICIAEESSAFYGVTKPVADGGLGFDYKWNMGWMNDVLFYVGQDPIFRSYHHNKLTFSMMYSLNENFILPLSHDEVVHMKGSIFNKSFGSDFDKFAGERLLLAFMYAHPGKKLNFMGYEFAQKSEWNCTSQLDFFLTNDENHAKMRKFVRNLNAFYKSTPALYQIETDWSGFKWLSVDDNLNNVIAFERYDLQGKSILAIFNFSGIEQKYKLRVDGDKYRRVLNTDHKKFGGAGTRLSKFYKSRMRANGDKYVYVKIPKLACIYLEKI